MLNGKTFFVAPEQSHEVDLSAVVSPNPLILTYVDLMM